MVRQRLAIATLILVSLSVSLTAQRVTRRVYISAADVKGAPVVDLVPAEVEVTEDGQKREVTAVTRGNAPLRIVLLVDSSTAMAQRINSFRGALKAFVDTLPPEHEVTFISTGGQIRIRADAKAGREKLITEIGRFATDNGANSMLETMYEADRRFLKTNPAQWPVFVIFTTDQGDARREPNIDEYNKFMNDFLARGGSAHAVVVVGQSAGIVSDLVENFVGNMGGLHTEINTDNVLPERAKEIAVRLAADHQRMANRFQVEYTGDGKLKAPVVNVAVTRSGELLRLQMSPRRPF